MATKETSWWVEDATTGWKMARGWAPDADSAVREATRYAMQYAEEGPVRWVVQQGRKNLLQGRMAGSMRAAVGL